jgi:stage III sporulation protein AC
MGVSMDILLIMKITVVGIIVSILNQVLKQSGRDELASLSTLSGLLIVLFWLLPYITELFTSIQQLFNLVN